MGRSADVLQLDLKAIERPGWVQVFEFRVHAKKQDDEGDGTWELLRGVVRSDERSNPFDVEYCDTKTRDRRVKKLRRKSKLRETRACQQLRVAHLSRLISPLGTGH